MPNISSADPAEALIREIENQSATERRIVIEAAERQAAAIVAAAHATARRRVHDALAEVRLAGEKRLARAAAQIDTERRLLDQARAAEILHTGCPSLINTVVDRWHDDALRRLWVTGLARLARQRLTPGAWVVEHPENWSAEDAADFRAALGVDSRSTLVFAPSGEFEAGLRIVAGSTVLDATPERLLADKATTQARLLAEMDRDCVLPAELVGGKP